MENVTKEDALKAGQIWNQAIAQNLELLTSITGMSKEALLDEFQKEVPNFIEKLKSGDSDILGLDELVKESENTNK